MPNRKYEKGGAGSTHAYQKGKRGETKTRRIIEGEGYYVIRSGGSKGLWDLVCYRTYGDGPAWRVVQVKNGVRISPKELSELREAVVPDETRKELWTWLGTRSQKPTIEYL